MPKSLFTIQQQDWDWQTACNHSHPGMIPVIIYLNLYHRGWWIISGYPAPFAMRTAGIV